MANKLMRFQILTAVLLKTEGFLECDVISLGDSFEICVCFRVNVQEATVVP